MGSCHRGMAWPQVADGVTTSSMEGGCEYIEQSRTADKGWSSSFGVGQGANYSPL